MPASVGPSISTNEPRRGSWSTRDVETVRHRPRLAALLEEKHRSEAEVLEQARGGERVADGELNFFAAF
jgi:hypothetical protein